jgi:hypothetical protein
MSKTKLDIINELKVLLELPEYTKEFTIKVTSPITLEVSVIYVPEVFVEAQRS